MSVHKKLMAVRCDLLRKKLEKTGHNKFAGYKYFELGDFLPSTMDLFYRHGLCGVVSYDNEFAKLCITDVDDGTVIVITSPMATAALKGAHDIQNLGAVETYQRRYLWVTALELTENDPIDAAEPVKEPVNNVKHMTPPEKNTYKVENPKPTKQKESHIPGVMIVGEADPMLEWEIKITGDGDDWADIVMEASKGCIERTASAADVQNIFKVNKALYDRLKDNHPSHYADLISQFTERKASFK